MSRGTILLLICRSAVLATLIVTAAVLISSCGGTADDGPGGAVGVDFRRHALLQTTDRVALYFFDGNVRCESIVGTAARPPSLVGPYAQPINAEERREGFMVVLTDEIPVGDYTIYLEALDPAGNIVGSGCAPAQRVFDRKVARLRLTVT